MKKWMIWLFAWIVAAAGYADLFTWDGGASTASFGTSANWDPDGTTYTTADDYAVSDGSSVFTDGQSFDVGSIRISGGSALTVSEGDTLSVTDNLESYWKNSGTLNVDGTADFGTLRVDNNSGISVLNVSSNGTLVMNGNCFLATAGGASFTANLSGEVSLKVAGGGSTAGVSTFAVYVNDGAAVDMNHSWTFRSVDGGSAAVYMNGGTLSLGATGGVGNGPEDFVYTDLVIAGGDDGIIFTDSSSQLVLGGNRTNDVNIWVSDGFLSSLIGQIQITYDSGQDETVVTADDVVDGPFSWDGGAGTASFGDAPNWDPDGTSFRAVDDYRITNGSSVVTAGQSFDLASIQVSGGSELTVSAGDSLALNDNLESFWKENGTLNVDGTVDFGTLRVDNNAGISVLNVSSTGSLVMNGNCFLATAGGSSFTANLSGNVSLKVAAGGSTAGVSTFAVYVNEGAVVDMNHSWTFRSVAGGSAAVYLNGGTVELGATGGVSDGPESFVYTDLTIDGGDDGVIFTDAASQILLEGNRTNDVNTWISDGFLSSQVGDLIISYSSSEDTTVVQPFAVPTQIGEVAAEMISEGLLMSWEGAAGVTYVVESTDDLVDGIWSNAFIAVGSGGTLSVTGSVDKAQEFFRVTIEE